MSRFFNPLFYLLGERWEKPKGLLEILRELIDLHFQIFVNEGKLQVLESCEKDPPRQLLLQKVATKLTRAAVGNPLQRSFITILVPEIPISNAY
ncbi:MAG: hypothetical protein DRQ02_07930 [Candidatus Latescibacterota bacterium]|nr:MAG: hypothetical protein DRQ02_07930 [Candidatus Latescibacterota bacterium]